MIVGRQNLLEFFCKILRDTSVRKLSYFSLITVILLSVRVDLANNVTISNVTSMLQNTVDDYINTLVIYITVMMYVKTQLNIF